MFPDFSVLMPVYHGNTSSELSDAIQSALDQSVKPTELVIVEDGPLTPELDTTLDSYQQRYPDVIIRYRLKENQGSGIARKIGVKNCTYDIIALMDADDVSVHTRFEQQLNFLQEHPDKDIVGSYLGEFDSDSNEIYALRKVPTTHDEIVTQARTQNTINQTTVMVRRQAILNAGNYRAFPGMEDYDLWVRMMLNGAEFGNIPSILAQARIDRQYHRRGGLTIVKAEIRLQYEFYRTGFISAPIFLFNVLTRTIVRLLPGRIRGRLISHYTRDSP